MDMITRPRCWTEDLSSLRDFEFLADDLPSHKWLGYFQLTIEGLLSGKQRAKHPDHQPDLNFKKAKAESNAAQKELI